MRRLINRFNTGHLVTLLINVIRPMDVFTASDALERKPTCSASAMGCAPTVSKVNNNNMHDEKDTGREKEKQKERITERK